MTPEIVLKEPPLSSRKSAKTQRRQKINFQSRVFWILNSGFWIPNISSAGLRITDYGLRFPLNPVSRLSDPVLYAGFSR